MARETNGGITKIIKMNEEREYREKQYNCKHPSWRCGVCHLYKNNYDQRPADQEKVIHELVETINHFHSIFLMYGIDEDVYQQSIKNVVSYFK